MDGQAIPKVLEILVYCASIAALVVVSRMRGPRGEIWIKNSIPLVFPKICTITGEPAVEWHPIRYFKGTPWWLQTGEVLLPFSKNGWDRYCEEFPLSLTIFRSGLDVLRRIPLFGGYLALYIWAPVAGFVCGLIAVYDLLRHKRPLLKVHGFSTKDEFSSQGGSVHGIGMSVINNSFAEELIRLNPGSSTGKKVWQFWW